MSSDPVRIYIQVIDVNNHLPEFKTDPVTFSVEENRIDAVVGTVTAVDEDKDSISCYSISGKLYC